jgi:hypothetical protein
VSSVARAREMDHAVEAGVRCAIALVPVRIQLLLGEHITAVLVNHSQLGCVLEGVSGCAALRCGCAVKCAPESRGTNK